VPKDEGAKASDYQGLWGTASPKAEALEGQDLNGDGKIDDNDSLEDINTAFTNLSGFIFKEGKVYTRNADGSEGAEITDKETLKNIAANKTLVESYLASGTATTAQMALYWSLMNNPENMP
jgi:hypothetical protein